jgi:argonaute-like protein implicated in RNA metabolism and viral defense
MKSQLKLLQRIYVELSELTDEDLVMEYEEKLDEIDSTFDDDTPDEVFDLMNKCEDMLEVVKDHFDNIARQEELEQELDERRYESMRHFS